MTVELIFLQSTKTIEKSLEFLWKNCLDFFRKITRYFFVILYLNKGIWDKTISTLLLKDY